jgi:glycosyltransferase involved in cell wall biosynthesis
VHILFDITLKLMLPWRAQPSGVDRLVFAHSRHWRQLPASQVTFVARTPGGHLAALPDGPARDYLAAVEERIAAGRRGLALRLKSQAAGFMASQAVGAGRGLLARRIAARPGSVLLTASSAILHLPKAIAALREAGVRFVPLLHDMIPVSHPEYSPASGKRRHLARIANVSELADGVLVVSAASRDAVSGHLRSRDMRCPPLAVAHPGLDLPRHGNAPHGAPSLGQDPYFVILSTIAPRKNHLLMLQLWREMASQGRAPRLVIIGRRGWENDTAFRLLDRGDFGGRVVEMGRLPDPETAALLRGATALLFPSLEEGFGIPLAEALAMAVPAIASDIPVFREVGGTVPEFLHPLDGPGWRDAILAMAEPGSVMRAAQLARLAQWQAPHWNGHFTAVERFLDRVLSPGG